MFFYFWSFLFYLKSSIVLSNFPGGEGNPLLPAKIACRYAVLGWFRITHVWPEPERNGKIRYKFRLEKLKFNDPSWWTPTNYPEPDESVAIECRVCSTCKKR